MTRVVAVPLMAIVMGAARGQSAPPAPILADVLAGKTCPLSYKLKDLDGDWRRVNIGQSSDTSGYLQMMMAAMGSGAQGDVYYTRGLTLAISGETYLVAYKAASKPLDMAALAQLGRSSTQAKPTALKPDDTLTLCLVNLRTAGSLTDIRAFDLQAETTAPPAAEETPAGAETRAEPAAPVSTLQGPEVASLSNLRQLGLALQMYTADYDGTLPSLKDAATVKKVLMPYCKNDALFVSPITGTSYRTNSALSGKKLKRLGDAAAIVALYDTKPGKDGKRGVVFADGQARRIPEKQWLALKRASKIP